jgi:hypothetical protein
MTGEGFDPFDTLMLWGFFVVQFCSPTLVSFSPILLPLGLLVFMVVCSLPLVLVVWGLGELKLFKS